MRTFDEYNKEQLADINDAVLYLRVAYGEFITDKPEYSYKKMNTLLQAVQDVVQAQGGPIRP